MLVQSASVICEGSTVEYLKYSETILFLYDENRILYCVPHISGTGGNEAWSTPIKDCIGCIHINVISTEYKGRWRKGNSSKQSGNKIACWTVSD